MKAPIARKVFLLTMSFACVVLFAAEAEAQSTEAYLTSTVKVVYPLNDGSFILKFNSYTSSCPDIRNPQYFHVTAGHNGVTADGVKTMLAAALTAYATGSPISIAFDTTTANCYLNRFTVGE